VSAAQAEAPLLQLGVVQDSVGHGLPGVEILVYSLGASAGAPLAVLLTDDRGRFSLEGIGTGSVLLALNKPGYPIRLAQANSRLLSLLQIRLGPETKAAPQVATPGDSMDWVLRLSRTDILKEEEPQIPQPSAAPEGESGKTGLASGSSSAVVEPGKLPVSGEVNQWYTSSLAGIGGRPEAPDSSGRATTVQVAGDLLGRGDWEVRGLAESLSTEGAGIGSGGLGGDQGANRLRLAMRYNVSPEDSVLVQARFDRDSYRSDADAADFVPANQAVRTLGYQANWKRSMGTAKGLEVTTGFLHAQARVPGGIEAGAEAGALAGDELRDWHWNAQAGYHLQLAREHHLSLAARTRVYSYDQRDAGWILTPMHSDLTMLDSGQRGWGLSLSGEDSWQLSQPLSLILGLDTHVSEGIERSVIVVPRIGARRAGEQSTLQGWILVRTDNLGSVESRQGDSNGRGGPESETLGFRAEILQKFQGNWVLSGHIERNPLGASALVGLSGAADSSTQELMFVTDPSAWSQEAGFSVTKRLRGVEGSIESDHGRVMGKMAGSLTEAPVLVLEDGGVRYLALKVTASVQKTDTRVHLDYTRLDGGQGDPAAGAPLSASRVDLSILQPIPFVSNRGAGSWKILLGFQSVSRDPGSRADMSEEALPDKINRFSGGVGVTF
jgi:hypothetical protein